MTQPGGNATYASGTGREPGPGPAPTGGSCLAPGESQRELSLASQEGPRGWGPKATSSGQSALLSLAPLVCGRAEDLGELPVSPSCCEVLRIHERVTFSLEQAISNAHQGLSQGKDGARGSHRSQGQQ